MAYAKKRNLPLAHQNVALVSTYPQFRKTDMIRGKDIVWEGRVQPMPGGKEYRVKISLRYKGRPEVTLPDENLKKRRPPHLFSGDALCLYHKYGQGAWSGDKPITELLPMIAHWLWCYEMWLVLGVWHGDEFPHAIKEKKVK